MNQPWVNRIDCPVRARVFCKRMRYLTVQTKLDASFVSPVP
jgi:hypothetical protein